jgi:hypothetical protein
MLAPFSKAEVLEKPLHYRIFFLFANPGGETAAKVPA